MDVTLAPLAHVPGADGVLATIETTDAADSTKAYASSIHSSILRFLRFVN